MRTGRGNGTRCNTLRRSARADRCKARLARVGVLVSSVHLDSLSRRVQLQPPLPQTSSPSLLAGSSKTATAQARTQLRQARELGARGLLQLARFLLSGEGWIAPRSPRANSGILKSTSAWLVDFWLKFKIVIADQISATLLARDALLPLLDAGELRQGAAAGQEGAALGALVAALAGRRRECRVMRRFTSGWTRCR